MIIQDNDSLHECPVCTNTHEECNCTLDMYFNLDEFGQPFGC